jgi:hypothetical protein
MRCANCDARFPGKPDRCPNCGEPTTDRTGPLVVPFFGGCLGALVFDTALVFLGPALVTLILRFDHQTCSDRALPFGLLAATTVAILLVAAWRIVRTRGRDYPQWAGFLIGTIVPFVPALVTLLRAARGCSAP